MTTSSQNQVRNMLHLRHPAAASPEDGDAFAAPPPLDPAARHAELARMAGGGPQGEALARSLEAAAG